MRKRDCVYRLLALTDWLRTAVFFTMAPHNRRERRRERRRGREREVDSEWESRRLSCCDFNYLKKIHFRVNDRYNRHALLCTSSKTFHLLPSLSYVCRCSACPAFHHTYTLTSTLRPASISQISSYAWDSCESQMKHTPCVQAVQRLTFFPRWALM